MNQKILRVTDIVDNMLNDMKRVIDYSQKTGNKDLCKTFQVTLERSTNLQQRIENAMLAAIYAGSSDFSTADVYRLESTKKETIPGRLLVINQLLLSFCLYLKENMIYKEEKQLYDEIYSTAHENIGKVKVYLDNVFELIRKFNASIPDYERRSIIFANQPYVKYLVETLIQSEALSRALLPEKRTDISDSELIVWRCEMRNELACFHPFWSDKEMEETIDIYEMILMACNGNTRRI